MVCRTGSQIDVRTLKGVPLHSDLTSGQQPSSSTVTKAWGFHPLPPLPPSAPHLQCLHFTPNIMLFWHTWQTCDSQDLVENLQAVDTGKCSRGWETRAWTERGPGGDRETGFHPGATGTLSRGGQGRPGSLLPLGIQISQPQNPHWPTRSKVCTPSDCKS